MAGVLTCLPPLLLLLTSSVVEANSHLTNDQAWQEWKTEYAKSYASSREEAERRELWAQEAEAVAKHNKRFEQGLETYTQAVYEWADEKYDSWSCLISRKGDQLTDHISSNTTKDRFWEQFRLSMTNEDPEDVDYRRDRFLTHIDFQGKCGACWAFAVAGSIEGYRVKNGGILEKLSTQQIIDCNTDGYGCHGGDIVGAMEYASKFGLMTAKDYPYYSEKKACKYDKNKVVFKFDYFEKLTHVSEAGLRFIVLRNGPVVSSILSTSAFKRYRGGIFTTDECNGASVKENHAVLVVGYGKDKISGDDFWILKNSHGSMWGEGGYMRMKRNEGMCSIGQFVVFPIELP